MKSAEKQKEVSTQAGFEIFKILLVRTGAVRSWFFRSLVRCGARNKEKSLVRTGASNLNESYFAKINILF